MFQTKSSTYFHQHTTFLQPTLSHQDFFQLFKPTLNILTQYKQSFYLEYTQLLAFLPDLDNTI